MALELDSPLDEVLLCAISVVDERIEGHDKLWR